MIAVRRTYLPKPGAGGRLISLIGDTGVAMEAAGFRKPKIYRGWHGLHGMLQTEQIWDSVDDYQGSREKVRQTPGITTLFDQIYPLLASTHKTEIFEILE